tara:strand:- start:5848 stop:6693 length:846 start_codon:yes stop_codon:yes gene_type:complete
MPESATVLGSTGMVGTDLLELLKVAGTPVTTVNRSSNPVELSVDSLAHLLESSAVVYNCLAYTDVDAAEGNEIEATEVNGHFVGRLAAACKKTGSHLFHISTDYVFEGQSAAPYSVKDNPNPQTAYGRSKLVGERALIDSAGDFTIFRTAWLYGASGSNFAKTIAKRLELGEPVSVVADQAGSPTWTKDLAQLLASYSGLTHAPEIVHASSSGSCSWFEFAQQIALDMGLDPDQAVVPASSYESNHLVKRPRYSVLDNSEGPLEPIGDWRSRWLASRLSIN